MINTIKKVMMVVPVLITSCHVSENWKMGPVAAHKMMINKAIKNAYDEPVARVTAFEKVSNFAANAFLFFFIVFVLNHSNFAIKVIITLHAYSSFPIVNVINFLDHFAV
jgi:hypothetical protein